MPEDDIAVIANQYINSLPPEEREAQQLEMNRFVRWFGADRPFSSLNGLDIERYQAQVTADGARPEQRLVPFKGFLTFAKNKGHLKTNLAKFVRIPRKKLIKDPRMNGGAEEVESITLSQEGYNKLKSELDQLVNVERAKVAQDLYNARLDKDIRENAGFDAAKQHQGLVEARIRELEAILGHAEVTANGEPQEHIAIGSKVVVRDTKRNRQYTYTLCHSQEANARECKISVESPVGRALLDHIEGEEVEVTTPGGVAHLKIERIEG